jgi:hypothetical protein
VLRNQGSTECEFDHRQVVRTEWIAVVCPIAMGVQALAALPVGRRFDRSGISVIIASVRLSFQDQRSIAGMIGRIRQVAAFGHR